MRRFGWITVICVALIIVITYVPFVYVVDNSFKSGQQYVLHPMDFMLTFHGSNYSSAWSGMSEYIGNTVIVAAIAVLIGVPAAAMGSYAFSQLQFRLKPFLFYCFVALLMIPWTLTLIPLFIEVHTFGLFNTWWALILPYAAGSQPLLIFLFRVFFEGIPAELYESARLDGCSEMGVLLRIVAPLAIPILLTGTILMVNNVWGDYLWPSLVIQNFHAQTVSAGLQIFVGSLGLNVGGAGPQFAAYVITMVPIMLLIAFTMRYFVRGVTNGALKM